MPSPPLKLGNRAGNSNRTEYIHEEDRKQNQFHKFASPQASLQTRSGVVTDIHAIPNCEGHKEAQREEDDEAEGHRDHEPQKSVEGHGDETVD